MINVSLYLYHTKSKTNVDVFDINFLQICDKFSSINCIANSYIEVGSEGIINLKMMCIEETM